MQTYKWNKKFVNIHINNFFFQISIIPIVEWLHFFVQVQRKIAPQVILREESLSERRKTKLNEVWLPNTRNELTNCATVVFF